MRALALKLYFYSNRNIIGTAAALVAATLTVAGLIHDYWEIVIAGAYCAGALLTPSNPRIEMSLARAMSDQEITAGLAQTAVTAKKLLPEKIATDVEAICTLLTQAIPLLATFEASSPVVHDVRTTATDYLPETLDHYLQMPKAFRATVRDRDGRTPTELLAEQITLLKGKLTEMMSDVAAADMDKIGANGRFLKEKFTVPEFADIVK